MPLSRNFLPDYPKDYQIYETELEVSGIQYRREEAAKFAKGSDHTLELEREPDNTHDKNAIKVFGISKGLFFAHRLLLGYVQKDVSKFIVENNLWEFIRPRLRHIFIGDNDYALVTFDIVGPKEKIKQYRKSIANQPAASMQKEFYRFFSLPMPKGLTMGDADETIFTLTQKWEKEDKGKLEEWDAFVSIYEELDNKDSRDLYSIKKVSSSLLQDALKKLKDQGISLKQIADDIDILVDKLIEIRPDLQKE